MSTVDPLDDETDDEIEVEPDDPDDWRDALDDAVFGETEWCPPHFDMN